LRRDHVEKFGAARQAEFVDLPQQLARQAQAVVDLETVVHVGIVDQPLPADCGARLFEIHAHDDFQFAVQTLPFGMQPGGIFQRRRRIVDRTGADHHHQPVVGAMQHAMHRLTALISGFGDFFIGRKFAQHMRRRG
jgi:hypothetical protein